MSFDVGDVIDRKYELVRLLGEGGMGTVFEGRHRRLDRRCALKFLHPELTKDHEMVTRLMREAKAAASIGSEHIVEVTDVGETEEGIPYVVMEYLEGEDLSELLKREEKVEQARAATLVIQACRALAAAHKRGIVHRDLKPENLFLTEREDGTEWIKVLDFGIAKFRDSMAKDVQRLTETGMTLGTPYYMSPEQARGARDLDHLSDIFSLGTILYELLSGHLPFQAATYNEVIIMIATSDPPPLSMHEPTIDSGLEKVVLKALSRDPRSRHQSTYELSDALKPYAYRISSLPPEAQQAHLREIELARTALPSPSLSASDIAELDTAKDEIVMEEEEPSFVDADTMPAEQGLYAPASRTAKLIGIGVIVVLFGLLLGVGVPMFMRNGGGAENRSSGDRSEEDPSGGREIGGSQAGVATAVAPVDSGADQIASDETDGSVGDEGGQGGHDASPRIEAAALVHLEITVRPRYATIRLDGEAVEGNPYTVDLVRDGQEHRIEASADGFTDGVETVVLDRDRNVELELERTSRRPRPASSGSTVGHPRPVKQPSSPQMPSNLRHIEDDNPYN